MLQIASRLTLAHREVQAVAKEENADLIGKLARKLVHAGADLIQVSSGPYPAGMEAPFRFLARAVQEAVNIPLCIDTLDIFALSEVLTYVRHPVLVRGANVNPETLKGMIQLLHDKDAMLTVRLANPGVPLDADARLDLAFEVLQLTQQLGFPLDRIYLDPVLMPLSGKWGQEYARQTLIFLDKLAESADPPVQTLVNLDDFLFDLSERDRQRFGRYHLALLVEKNVGAIIYDMVDRDFREAVRTARELTGRSPLELDT